MDNPTIGVFSKQLDHWTSGSGHHLHEMMSHVLDLNTKLRFVFIHYKPSENSIYQRVDDELIIPRNPLRAAAAIRKYHKEVHPFDVLHFTPVTFFAPIWGTPGVHTATNHGFEQLLVPQFYGPIEMLHERTLVPFYFRQMDHILSVSNTSKQFLIDYCKVDPERITVAYNAVNDAYRVLPEKDRRPPEGLKLAPGQRYIFHISRFSGRKNPWTLLRAFAEFAKRPAAQDVKLVIAGGRWDNEQVHKELARLEIEDKVVLAGFVEEEEAVQLFNSATAFVFPSLAEGFGMPNIEAMACGCPVITTPIFAIPEVVGDAAVIVKDPKDPTELADTFERVVSNEELQADLRNRGLKHAEGFRSWVPSARRMLNMWEKIVGVECT